MDTYEKKYNEAQKWIESIYSELSHEQQMEAEAFFPELKESEDEKIRKEILHFIKKRDRSGCDYDYDKWIAWLEKQGKNDILEDAVVDSNDDGLIADALRNKKIEPKFKVGNWITNGDYTWKIIEVKPLAWYYILQSQDGNIVDDTISHVDGQFHSFTIEDAKDGDVLACPLPKGCESGEQIFIFKGINSRDYVDNCIEYYCRVYEGVFYENENGNGYMGTTSSPLYPATKEQRNILFAKMKEAGYEWNTEKKELKKISQRMVSAEAKEALYDKPAWSEEDEDAIRMAIIALEDMYDEDAPNTTYGGYNLPFNKAAERLKSIKERYTWKPSDEQMRALHDLNLTGNISYVGQGQVLIELYNDLKKLTE